MIGYAPNGSNEDDSLRQSQKETTESGSMARRNNLGKTLCFFCYHLVLIFLFTYLVLLICILCLSGFIFVVIASYVKRCFDKLIKSDKLISLLNQLFKSLVGLVY